MPQPIKDDLEKGFMIHLGTDHMRKRPEHMTLIGLISHEWALIEMSIFDAFVQLCGGHKTWGISATIFEELESLSLRLDIVGSLIRVRAPNLSVEFEKIIRPRIRKAAGERNAIIHGKWGIHDKYPSDVLRIRMANTTMRYSVQDFEEILTRIGEASGLIGKFTVKLVNLINPEPNSR